MILKMFNRLAWFRPNPRRYTAPVARPAVLAVVLMGFLVSACGLVDELTQSDIPPPCPTVSILGNAERVTQFSPGPGRDLIDITAEAKIHDFQARCIYDVDDETGIGQVHVELSVGISAARGAANTNGSAEIPYFVSVTGHDKAVMSKNIFTITALFEGNRYRVSAYDEPVVLSIPIKAPQTGLDFLIYIGFQLTPEQLEYNRYLRHSTN